MSSLKGKKIILGITGSIAAYKAAVLLRLLVKQGAEVQVVITPAGKEFITPLTLSTLSSKPVISEFFSNRDGTWNSHVDLGLWADAMLIAPATAATIGKMAHGVADNMLITTYLSAKSPVFVAPAMDLDMFAHPSTQANLDILRSYGNHIIEPGEGQLASHLVGKGRMEEPDEIVNVLASYFQSNQPLSGVKALVTAGPTYERIDPVRFIGNFSTGQMGFAIADALAKRGADVKLVTGPTSLQCNHPNISRIDVESANQMLEACQANFADSTLAVFSAAVADYRPAVMNEEKIKRDKSALHSIELEANPDIAATLGKQKTEAQLCIGFALESDAGVDEALRKLKSKNFDAIILNSLQDKGAGFAHATNKITIFDRNGLATPFPLKSKIDVAEDIVKHIISILP